MHLGLGIAEEFRAGCPKQPDRIIVKPLYSETSYNHHRQTIKRGDTKDQSPEDTLPVCVVPLICALELWTDLQDARKTPI